MLGYTEAWPRRRAIVILCFRTVEMRNHPMYYLLAAWAVASLLAAPVSLAGSENEFIKIKPSAAAALPDLIVIDVREPHEWDICHIEGAKLIPLGDLESRIGDLDADDEIIVHCKMGGRGAQAQDILTANGFANVLNMAGGILRWADDVDPSMPRD